MPEIHPRFFIEETSFRLEASPQTDVIAKCLETFIELLRACREKGERIVRSKTFYEIEVSPGLSLMDLLFQRRPMLELDPIVKKSLQLALNHCIEWDAQSSFGAGSVEMTNDTDEAPTISTVHAHPGDSQLAEGRLFVGLFHAHLAT